jgi:putative OmpL-like beta-barrel porin-2
LPIGNGRRTGDKCSKIEQWTYFLGFQSKASGPEPDFAALAHFVLIPWRAANPCGRSWGLELLPPGSGASRLKRFSTSRAGVYSMLNFFRSVCADKCMPAEYQQRCRAVKRVRSYLSVCSIAFALAGGIGTAVAQEAPPPAMPMMPPMSPVSTPAMAGPLSANVNPISLDLGPLAPKIYITGAVTALGFLQDNATHVRGDSGSVIDLSNGQVFIQKADGLVQFYVQAGVYSIPALGTPYLSMSRTMDDTYGFVPQAFLKIAPTDSFNIMAGKLPTLVGAEYTFSFENMDIFRGLLWDQEPAVSRGVQVNYTLGPLALSASLNDGYYSNRYNWLSGSAAWTIDMADTVSFVGAGNFGHTGYSTFATPLFQNNGSIFNLIYTHSDGPWVITPYVQYARVSVDNAIGIPHDASTTGVALLASYGFNDNLKLAGRIEYIDSSGKGATLATSTNLLYGPGSSAWSFTITPTYQFNIFYVRADYSLVTASSTTPGFGFGRTGTGTSQNRFAVEGGVLF